VWKLSSVGAEQWKLCSVEAEQWKLRSVGAEQWEHHAGVQFREVGQGGRRACAGWGGALLLLLLLRCRVGVALGTW